MQFLETQFMALERIHEILIVITRSFIAIMTSMVATMLYITWQITSDVSSWWSPLAYIIFDILSVIDDITCCLSVYFIYQFSYSYYRHLCGICHDKFYAQFLKRQQNQISYEISMQSYVELSDDIE